jgi:hypothetical protein
LIKEELSKNKEASAVRKKVIVEFASLTNYEQSNKSLASHFKSLPM